MNIDTGVENSSSLYRAATAVGLEANNIYIDSSTTTAGLPIIISSEQVTQKFDDPIIGHDGP